MQLTKKQKGKILHLVDHRLSEITRIYSELSKLINELEPEQMSGQQLQKYKTKLAYHHLIPLSKEKDLLLSIQELLINNRL